MYRHPIAGDARRNGYYYESVTAVAFPGRPSVRVIARVLPGQRISAREFGSTVDHCWSDLRRSLDQILVAAEPLVTGTIERFWSIEDESPPSASDVLSSAQLEQIAVEVSGECELHLHDAAECVGGHDLIIELDAALRPVSAQLDG